MQNKNEAGSDFKSFIIDNPFEFVESNQQAFDKLPREQVGRTKKISKKVNQNVFKNVCF